MLLQIAALDELDFGAAAQSVSSRPRAIPRFEVDPGWLKVPQGWVLGQDEALAHFQWVALKAAQLLGIQHREG